jgi:hypothetical protein
VTAGILLCGISIGTIARFPNDLVALIGCLGIGVGASLMVIAATALMQGQVPHEMRGRVSSSTMSLISISQVSRCSLPAIWLPDTESSTCSTVAPRYLY